MSEPFYLDCPHCADVLIGDGPDRDLYGEDFYPCAGCARKVSVSCDGETDPYVAEECETSDTGDCTCPEAGGA